MAEASLLLILSNTNQAVAVKPIDNAIVDDAMSISCIVEDRLATVQQIGTQRFELNLPPWV